MWKNSSQDICPQSFSNAILQQPALGDPTHPTHENLAHTILHHNPAKEGAAAEAKPTVLGSLRGHQGLALKWGHLLLF